MTTHLLRIAMTAVLGLTIAACGGDDGNGGPSGGAQNQVAQLLIDEFDSEEGFSVNESCVRGVTAQLSNADAQAILAAYPDGEPELSLDTEAEDAFFMELFECLEFEFDDD